MPAMVTDNMCMTCSTTNASTARCILKRYRWQKFHRQSQQHCSSLQKQLLSARHCSTTHLLEDEVELGLNSLAYQGARPTLASQSTLFQFTVSQSSCTKPLVSPELAFHAHQNTLLMALCSPSAPSPAPQLLPLQHTLNCLVDCPSTVALL